MGSAICIFIASSFETQSLQYGKTKYDLSLLWLTSDVLTRVRIGSRWGEFSPKCNPEKQNGYSGKTSKTESSFGTWRVAC